MNEDDTLYPLTAFPNYSYRQLRRWKPLGLRTNNTHRQGKKLRPEKTCKRWIDEFERGETQVAVAPHRNKGGRPPKRIAF